MRSIIFSVLFFLLAVHADSRLSGTVILNVRYFGAYGDGVHDDTVAVQNALARVPYDPVQPYGVYFPSGTYRCDLTTPVAAWPGSTATHIFCLTNRPLTIYGDGISLSKIVTSKATTLFDGYPNAVCQTSQTLLVHDLSIQYTGGPTTSSKAFAFTCTGNRMEFDNVQFQDWTNALRGPEGQAQQCGFLKCSHCQFLTTYGVPLIADDDPNYGYPTTSILGGGLTTVLQSCYFNGATNSSVSGQGMDGIIKTINQVTSITISGCTVMNNREECIVVETQNIPTECVVNISSNVLGPHYKSGWGAGLSLWSVQGNATNNIIQGESDPVVVVGGDPVTSANTIL